MFGDAGRVDAIRASFAHRGPAAAAALPVPLEDGELSCVSPFVMAGMMDGNDHLLPETASNPMPSRHHQQISGGLGGDKSISTPTTRSGYIQQPES